jgi:hypothetical protein
MRDEPANTPRDDASRSARRRAAVNHFIFLPAAFPPPFEPAAGFATADGFAVVFGPGMPLGFVFAIVAILRVVEGMKDEG